VHIHSITKRSAAAVLFAFLAVSTGARAAEAAVPSPIKLVVEDALGESVPLGMPSQARPTILFFMSERSRDESAEFARAVDEKLLNGAVESLAIVDVRKYGGMLFKRICQSHLRTKAKEARDKRRQRRVERGLDSSTAVVNRWHLAGDFTGAWFSRFGVERDPAKPVAFVVDRDGALRGPFRDPGEVLAAVGPLLAHLQ
jgi:hypothetical protein